MLTRPGCHFIGLCACGARVNCSTFGNRNVLGAMLCVPDECLTKSWKRTGLRPHVRQGQDERRVRRP